MSRSNGGKNKPKNKSNDLGKALQKKQAEGLQGMGNKTVHTTNMASILDNTTLDDFIITAEMDEEEVQVKRVHQHDAFLVDSGSQNTAQAMTLADFSFQHLVIPRKPAWNKSMTADEVDYNEKRSFLEWRRNIAALEVSNDYSQKVTPFEKNLDVWRQLWRAVERSEIIVQIVDARNPLLYFTNDLLKYAAEQSVHKPMMLLINKADFLTDYHRTAWVKCLNEMGLKFLFYSAKNEQNLLDIGQDNTEANVSKVDVMLKYFHAQWSKKTESSTSASASSSDVKYGEISEVMQAEIFSRADLILFFESLPKLLGMEPKEKHHGRVCIGMVGYPNVGKSSVINTLLGVSKSSHGVVRVGVSSTPGKTKHLQTIELSACLMLCDCPGLVFPSFMNSTAEMICAGILPINHMRDYIEPARIIATRIPAHLLDAAYGMHIVRELDMADEPDRAPTPHEMLCAYCMVKGYITNGTGRWDEFRACKELLRDFADGRILYVAAPPTESGVEVDMPQWLKETEVVMVRKNIVAERLKQNQNKAQQSEHNTASLDGVDLGELNLNDEAGSEQQSTVFGSATEKAGREHKRLRHWGKKNKKLRDKNPYAEGNGTEAFVIQTTDRRKGVA